MRPTFSIICFTVLSGVGYGAWFLQGMGWMIGAICGPRSTSASGVTFALCSVPFATPTGLVLAYLLVSAGLLFSLGHLGKPRRAWRALSQWRSSWLSREGVAALLTLIPATLLLARSIALMLIAARMPPEGMQAPEWMFDSSPAVHVLGCLLAAGSLLTVFCTANIYACLKPIRAWHSGYVTPAYLLLSLYGGALLLLASGLVDGAMWQRDRIVLMAGTIVLAAICTWLKSRYWRSIDAQVDPGAGHATGLDGLGSVHSFEQPHTEENYLTHEMGFVLARKHSRKLRTIALVAGFVVPALLAALGLAMPASTGVVAWLALVSGMFGIFVERWLFFAEAKHAVMAYYAR